MAQLRFQRRMFRAKAHPLPARAPLYALHASKSQPVRIFTRRRWREPQAWFAQRRRFVFVPQGVAIEPAEICLCDFDINPVITLASLDVNPVVTLSDFDISPPCDC